MGCRETNTVYFNDCEVREEQLLGEPDHGWMQLMARLSTERLILATELEGARLTTPWVASLKNEDLERMPSGRPRW
jgi:alkylation response protein AidB-like acyl-CoA dehydrogenase